MYRKLRVFLGCDISGILLMKKCIALKILKIKFTIILRVFNMHCYIMSLTTPSSFLFTVNTLLLFYGEFYGFLAFFYLYAKTVNYLTREYCFTVVYFDTPSIKSLELHFVIENSEL